METPDLETWIALLRGINVGGKNKLPMAGLVSLTNALGLSDAKTHVQSGNLVFRCSRHRQETLAGDLISAIQAQYGFSPDVMVMSEDRLKAAVDANPFPAAANEEQGNTLHFFFLEEIPLGIDKNRLDALRRASEQWQCIDSVFYLFAPEGFGRSKLALNAEKCLSVRATAGN